MSVVGWYVPIVLRYEKEYYTLKYLYQSFLNLPTHTLIAATKNDQLKEILLLHNAEMINKYLAPSPATSKGRLKKQGST